MERADIGNTHIHHSIHFLLLCTRSLEYKCVNSVLFTFVRHRWSQGHKCDVLVWYNRYIKAHNMDDVYLQQPATFISLMRSTSPQVERRLKGLPVHQASVLFPFSPNPAARRHACCYIFTRLHQINRSAAIHKQQEWTHGQQCSQQR